MVDVFLVHNRMIGLWSPQAIATREHPPVGPTRDLLLKSGVVVRVQIELLGLDVNSM